MATKTKAKESAIDLTPYCDDPGGRYSLDTPFVIDGWKYATDGRCCVRIPCEEPNTDGRKIPKANELFADVVGLAYETWPNSPIHRCKGPCVFCHGDKMYPSTVCKNCGGNGYMEHEDCARCDGVGYVGPKCFNCDGIGWGLACCHQEILGVELSFRYVRLIEKLPGPLLIARHSDEFVAFRFDGGEGLLAPLQHH